MRRKAGPFSRRLDDTDKNVRVFGISKECRIGFRIYLVMSTGHTLNTIDILTCSSRSHSLKTSLRRPHSIVKTSESTDAFPRWNCMPEKSTARGCATPPR